MRVKGCKEHEFKRTHSIFARILFKVYCFRLLKRFRVTFCRCKRAIYEHLKRLIWFLIMTHTDPLVLIILVSANISRNRQEWRIRFATRRKLKWIGIIGSYLFFFFYFRNRRNGGQLEYRTWKLALSKQKKINEENRPLMSFHLPMIRA